MNVRELLESVESTVCELSNEPQRSLRLEIYLDFIDQLDAIRAAVGLPTEICWGCGEDGLYDCMDCGEDYCGLCVEKAEDGYLCQGCGEARAEVVRITVMSSA